MEPVSLSNSNDKPKSSEIRDKSEHEFLQAQHNTELGSHQANLNEVEVPLSQNDGGQDVKDGSIDNMEESPRTIRVDNIRDTHRKDE